MNSYLLFAFRESHGAVLPSIILGSAMPSSIELPLSVHALTETAVLNAIQLQAVKMSLTQQLTVVHGPPGTGKTKTILAVLSIEVVRLNNRVIVAAPSHAIVDNIMRLFLAQETLSSGIVRLGSKMKISTDLHQYVIPCTTVQSLQHARIIFATLTAVGASYEVLSKHPFHIGVIDECGRCLEAACWPLVFVVKQRLILLGDHHQLGPVVSSKKAEKRGLGKTLFVRMLKKYPMFSILLTTQYRMDPLLMQ